MPGAQQILHNGQVVFYMDFSNANHTSEIKNIMNESAVYIHNQPSGSVLSLSNITGMRFTQEIKVYLTILLKRTNPT